MFKFRVELSGSSRGTSGEGLNGSGVAYPRYATANFCIFTSNRQTIIQLD